MHLQLRRGQVGNNDRIYFLGSFIDLLQYLLFEVPLCSLFVVLCSHLQHPNTILTPPR